MINSIIEGISTSLNAEFGDDYTIYTENVEQGLKEPCFLFPALTRQVAFSWGNDISKPIRCVSTIFRQTMTEKKRNAMMFRNACLIVWSV